MARSRGAITEKEREFVEVWENVSPTQTYIIKLDPRGVEYQELAPNNREFFVTTEERLLMENRIEDVKNNPYRNGVFRPVEVPPDVNVETNPNALSDDDIKNIFKSSDVAWAEWMQHIDSPGTLRRMMELADNDEVDISLKRFREVEARFTEVNPKRRINVKDREKFEKI